MTLRSSRKPLFGALWAASVGLTALALVSCSAVLGFETLTMSSPDAATDALNPVDGPETKEAAADAIADVASDVPITPACNQVHVTTFAGTVAAGLVDGPGTTARFNLPEGIIVDPAGTLYVADTMNARIRKVLSDATTSTLPVTTFLQPHTVSFGSGFTDFYVADSANDQLFHVNAAGVSSSVLALSSIHTVGRNPATGTYVADAQSCSIKVLNASNTLDPFSGNPAATSPCVVADGLSAAARYGLITAFAFDAANFMYAADPQNFRIRRVGTGGTVSTLAGSVAGHADGVGAAATFEGPTGVTVDEQRHRLYVADKTTIRVIAAGGDVTTLVGSTSGTEDGDGCTARFGALQGIAFFAGALYVVDVNRIRKVVMP